MKSEIFRGVGTALITPHKDGAIDYPSLELLIERQIDAGIEALIIGGTTGEAATLTDGERYELFRFSREAVRGRCKLILGTGTNDTAAAIRHTMEAEKIGCDGVLLVTPYYNKGTREGIFKHYEALSKCTDLSIVLYNVPSRTGVDLSPDTVRRLSKYKNIIALKEASGSRERLSEIGKISEIGLYAGNDRDTLFTLSLGGLGVISVLSNLYPKRMHRLTEYYGAGKYDLAVKLERELLPMMDTLFLDTNPAPVKYALSRLGLCTGEMRLPLYEVDRDIKAKIDHEMDMLGTDV